jgi:D-beta-D-heptose 7-phosphate kinase/D-beta-D-heptose 1-phosphate adenosyltransferase
MQPQKQYTVLLIGETCEDSYIYGTVDRISPEAPIPILNYERTETSLGMSANVKNNLESFGVFVNHITNKKLIKKRRFVHSGSNQQILRVDEDNFVDPIKPSEVRSAFLHLNYDAVVISDYDKGFLTTQDLKVFCQNFKGPVFIDTKKRDLFTEPNVIFKINQREYNNLITKPEPQHLIVTKGSSGVEYCKLLYPVDKVNVFDVVGAGDTFLAAFVYAFLQYENYEARLDSSIRFANKAAAISVQHYGCYTLTQEDIRSI